MYGSNIFRQAVDYQKTLLDNSYSMMSAIQDQGFQMVDQAIEKNALIPEGSKKLCVHWVDFIKQNRDNCKEYMDTSIERFNEFFAEPASPAPKTPEKNTAKKAS